MTHPAEKIAAIEKALKLVASQDYEPEKVGPEDESYTVAAGRIALDALEFLTALAAAAKGQGKPE
jgi:hypothetical protein